MTKHEQFRQAAIDDAKHRKARAERFERFLEEEGFDETIAQWEQELVEGMIACKANQDKERYRYAVAVDMVRRFRGWINQAVNDGKVSKHTLKEIEGNPRWRSFH